MKKLLSIILSFVLMTLFCSSCSFKKNQPLTVSGAKLNNEIYSYFMQEIMAENEDVTDIDSIKKLTSERCAQYVAVNTLFKNTGSTLSDSAKMSISENTRNIWFFYSDYYKDIGVSKQTITKVQQYLAYKDYLLDFYYGENGVYPVSDKDIKDYFSENYVAFKAINGYLTTLNSDGETIALSDAEVEAIKTKFTTMAAEMNATGGPDIDTVNQKYMAEQGTTSTEKLETLILEKTSTSYPAEFFNNVSQMTYNTAYVRILESYIFLIQRIDLSTSDDLFKTYKSSCLSALKANDFEDIIKKEAEAYSISDDSDMIEKCYEKISDRRSEIEK